MDWIQSMANPHGDAATPEENTMKSLFTLGIAAITLVASQAQANTFPNGKSYYGSPAPAGNYRTVDLSQKGPINIVCGETVNFTSQGQTFAWRLSSIQHNRVAVSNFAPAGFDTQGRAVYITPGEHERGG
ncbi:MULTISPECIES: CzcE family metal-binding protein [Delftia]|nr:MULTISPECIES: CzcE family metal-binding protein [Delftia]